MSQSSRKNHQTQPPAKKYTLKSLKSCDIIYVMIQLVIIIKSCCKQRISENVCVHPSPLRAQHTHLIEIRTWLPTTLPAYIK